MNALARSLGDNLSAAWAIMLGRQEGIARLDCTVEGFWRSFGAIVLVAPFALLTLMSQARLLAEDGQPAAITLFPHVIGLLADWVAFPLAFALLARPLKLSDRYVPFIVARNWAAVLVSAAVSVVHAAHLIGLLPSGPARFVLLVAVVVALRFSYVIARTTLAVSFAVAAPIVAFDFLLSMTLWTIIDRLAA